jgi:hypothetical protein
MMRSKAFYRITVSGQLNTDWSDWLDGLKLENDPHGNTEIAGWIPDQAALHSLLVKIRDMGLVLINVSRDEIE